MIPKTVKTYLAKIGRAGGKAGKDSPARAAAAKKANAARWRNHSAKKANTERSGPPATTNPDTK
jgi:hypothetical protein